jgi:hypothetical protein
MKPSPELFDLIQSLTKSEKRFFKLQSALQAGDKNYLKIFDAIERMKSYDERSLKMLFHGERFIKHLPSEKNHLYKLILRSLRSYHAETTVDGSLRQEIKNVEILYMKGLHAEAMKLLHRSKKIAHTHEMFHHVLELIHWEKTILEETYENGNFNDVDGIIREEQEVLNRMTNLSEYHVLYSKINYLFRSGGFSRTDEDRAMMNEIGAHPLIVGKNTALSVRAASICYYTQGFCQLASGSTEEALVRFKRVKDLLDQQPHIREDLMKRYVRSIARMIECSISLGQLNEVPVLLNLLEDLSRTSSPDHPDYHILLWRETAQMRLRWLIRTEDYSEALEFIRQLDGELEERSGKLMKEHLAVFHYLFVVASIGAKDLHRALYWVNQLMNDNENELRQDLFAFARILNVIVHYELGNYELLEYNIRSAMRYLQRRQRDFPMEMQLLESIKKMIKLSSAEKHLQIWITLSESLEGYQNAMASNDPLLHYFDIARYVQSKMVK